MLYNNIIFADVKYILAGRLCSVGKELNITTIEKGNVTSVIGIDELRRHITESLAEIAG